jgi:purine-cytosine permease-like protein
MGNIDRNKSVLFVFLVAIFGASAIALLSRNEVYIVAIYLLLLALFVSSPFRKLLMNKKILLRLVGLQAYFLLIASLPIEMHSRNAIILLTLPIMFYLCLYSIKESIKEAF